MKRHSIFLIAVTACLLIACAGNDKMSPVDEKNQAFADFRNEVRAAVEDPARQDEIIALVDILERDIRTLRESITDRNQRSRKLNENYDTRRADYDALINEVRGKIKANQQRATKSHRALLAATTPEEWSELSKARTKAIRASIKSMQAT